MYTTTLHGLTIAEGTLSECFQTIHNFIAYSSGVIDAATYRSTVAQALAKGYRIEARK